MTITFNELAAPGVRRLKPYAPGKPISELEREYGVRDAIKLASNENPLGPGRLAVAALQQSLPELARYPDGNGFMLKAALATKLAVDVNQITLGNGSNDVLEIIARSFVTSADEVIFSEHAFAVYPILTQAIGAQARVAPACRYAHDLAAMQALVSERTRLVFIANPNNPTGTWLTFDALEGFIGTLPKHVLIVVDQAYFEYASSLYKDYPDSLPWLARYPNLIVTRTFSKAYGLAGLRIGYAVSHPDVAAILNRVRQPFNVNSLALTAALAALEDTDHLARTLETHRSGIAQLSAAFTAMGLDFIPSAGNFVALNMAQEAEPVYQALLHKGVIVRPIANYGMPRHLRITVGLVQENERLINALCEVLT